jgi:hypothetical protein
MNRKWIEPEKGAIAPTSRDLWDAAREKLAEAESALRGMREATDRVSFEGAWSTFVDSIEEFWCRFFDEGKATFSAFQPWAGAIERGRRSDETLQYFYQARHQSQHGRIPMAWERPQLIIGRGFAGSMYGLKIYPDGSYEDRTETDSPTGKPFRVESAPGKPILPTIENSYHKQVFPPPKFHAGSPLPDASPVTAAQLVLTYYTRVLSRAIERFTDAGGA